MTISKRAKVGGGGGDEDGGSFFRSNFSKKGSSSNKGSGGRNKGGGGDSGSGGGRFSSSSLKRDRGWDEDEDYDNDHDDDHDDFDGGFGNFESGSEGEYYPSSTAFRRTATPETSAAKKRSSNPWSPATPKKKSNTPKIKIIPVNETELEEELRRDRNKPSIVNSILEDDTEESVKFDEYQHEEEDDEDEDERERKSEGKNKKDQVVVKKRNGRPSTKGMSGLLDEDEMESYKGSRSTVVVESEDMVHKETTCIPDHLNEDFLLKTLGDFSGPRCPACRSMRMPTNMVLNYKDEIKKLMDDFLSNIDSLCPYEHCIYFAEEYNRNVILPHNERINSIIAEAGIRKDCINPITPRDVFKHFTKCKIIPRFLYKLNLLAATKKSDSLLRDSEVMVTNKNGDARMISDFNLSKVWLASQGLVDKLLSKKLHSDSIFLQNHENEDRMVTISMKESIIPLASLKVVIPRMLPPISQIEEIE